jgi:hypothetical protein
MGTIDARGCVCSHAGQVSWRGRIGFGGMMLKDKMPMKMVSVAVSVAMAVLMMMMEACSHFSRENLLKSFLLGNVGRHSDQEKFMKTMQ